MIQVLEIWSLWKLIQVLETDPSKAKHSFSTATWIIYSLLLFCPRMPAFGPKKVRLIEACKGHQRKILSSQEGKSSLISAAHWQAIRKHLQVFLSPSKNLLAQETGHLEVPYQIVIAVFDWQKRKVKALIGLCLLAKESSSEQGKKPSTKPSRTGLANKFLKEKNVDAVKKVGSDQSWYHQQ